MGRKRGLRGARATPNSNARMYLHLTQSLFRLRYYSVPGRQLLYDVIVDTNIQFERADSTPPITQMASSGPRFAKTKSWPSASRNPSAPMPSGNSSRTIRGNMQFQFPQPKESTSTLSIKSQTPLWIIYPKCCNNYRTSLKNNGMKELHPYS